MMLDKGYKIFVVVLDDINIGSLFPLSNRNLINYYLELSILNAIYLLIVIDDIIKFNSDWPSAES